MSSFFGMFRSKKHSSKEKEQSTELDRDMSYRRSHRSASSSSKPRRTRFDIEEDYLHPAAPYHVQTAPKLHKGPQSCPGGIRGEEHRNSMMNRSFDTTDSQSERKYKRDKYDRGDKYRRSTRDTSEYGSGDPSPVGHIGRPYPRELEEDSDEDYEEYAKTKEMEQMDQMERALERARDKLKYSEQRHVYYKNKCRQIQQSKEEMEKAYMSRVNELHSEKNKIQTKMQDEINSLRKQLQTMQMPPSFGMGMPAHFGQQAQFGAAGNPYGGGFAAPFPLSVPSQRMPLMQSMNGRPSNTNTPLTRGGAGEALTEPSDVSLSNINSSFNSKADSKDVSFFQNFNNNDMETPRSNGRTSPIDETNKHDSSNTLLTNKECGASNSTVCEESPSKSVNSTAFRRCSSDPISLPDRNTDL